MNDDTASLCAFTIFPHAPGPDEMADEAGQQYNDALYCFNMVIVCSSCLCYITLFYFYIDMRVIDNVPVNIQNHESSSG